MGTLEHLKAGRRVELATEMLIGRSPRCHIVLDHPTASTLHAQLRWMGAEWCLKDVSRNGTWVNGRACRPEELVSLAVGDAVCFGRNEDPWELQEAGAPRALIIPFDSTEPRVLSNGPVALPSEEDAAVSVFLDPDGGAVLESPGQRRRLNDGDEFFVTGHRYQIQLSSPQPLTASAGVCLDETELVVEPAAHEEHVGVTLTLAGRKHVLRPRVHFSLLLELARERLADRQRGLEDDREGWVSLTDLCQRLAIDRPTLNTYAHRLRKQFDSTELIDAVNIIQRRVDSDELRLGCRNVSVR